MTELHKSRIGQQFLDGTREGIFSIAKSLETIAKEISLIRQLAEAALPEEAQRTGYVISKQKQSAVSFSEPRPAFTREES